MEKIDRTYPEFDLDARNIRFGLSTDGMNPFGEMSSGHSTLLSPEFDQDW